MARITLPQKPAKTQSPSATSVPVQGAAPRDGGASSAVAQRLDRLDGSGTAGAAQGSARVPGSWRGPPDSDVGQLVRDMAFRLRKSSLMIDGETPLSLFARGVLDNPRVTNEHLLGMRRATLEQMGDTPEEQARTLAKYPDIREHPAHRFCAAIFGAAMGVEPEAVSRVAPSLGLTGAPSTPLLYLAGRERMQRNTILHDLTEHMRARAGVDGLNKAVWGAEGQFGSTLCVPLNVHRGWSSRKRTQDR